MAEITPFSPIIVTTPKRFWDPTHSFATRRRWIFGESTKELNPYNSGTPWANPPNLNSRGRNWPQIQEISWKWSKKYASVGVHIPKFRKIYSFLDQRLHSIPQLANESPPQETKYRRMCCAARILPVKVHNGTRFSRMRTAITAESIQTKFCTSTPRVDIMMHFKRYPI